MYQIHHLCISLPNLYPCCSCSATKLCLTLCDPKDCSPADSSVLHSFLEFLLKFIDSVMLCNHLILAAHFSFCPQSFPASGSFPVSWLFTSSSQNITAEATVLPMNIQGWFLLGLTGLICCSPRDSQESSLAPQFKNPVDSMKKILPMSDAKCQLLTAGVPKTLPV